MQENTERRDRDRLTRGQRVGEFIGVLLMMLLLAFFNHHLIVNSGFFTEKFGWEEMLLFYGPMLFAMAAPIVRIITGRRNVARPVEAASNVFMALAAVRLLNVFPFDFTHMADTLPESLRSILSWVNNDIGRIGLTLQIIVCPVVAVFTMITFASVRVRQAVTMPQRRYS